MSDNDSWGDWTARGPRWLNEPPSWAIRDDVLVVNALAHSDFWRITEHGFIHDNGHLCGIDLTGDFVVRATVEADYAEQYDQAGLMLWASDTIWIKCGIEYVDARQLISAVATNDRSDWSCWPLTVVPQALHVEMRRHGDAVTISFAVEDGPLTFFRTCPLDPDLAVLVGPMVAAPTSAGLEARFRDIAVEA